MLFARRLPNCEPSMTKMVYSPRFARELSRVTSARVEQKIYDTLDVIEAVPSIGSRNIPRMIQVEFGEGVLKMVVDPFDIFYEYFDALDTVYVYTLVFQRQAR